jgi:hypothetical protein
LSPAGTLPALFGATAGAVVAICVWFKVVGYFVQLEDDYLSRAGSRPAPETASHVGVGPSLISDARRGNHMMACGIVTFLSALFSPPGIMLLVGAAGVLAVVVGFVISLAAAEFPAEEGMLRRVKLLVTKTRA